MDRYYTVTLKPNTKSLQGNMQLLREHYLNMLDIVGGQTEELTFEKVDSKGLHLHSLIKCPYIASKYNISKALAGYHLHLKVISKKADQQTVKDTWCRYIHKERSDADRFYNVFGNMFPLDEIYNAEDAQAK